MFCLLTVSNNIYAAGSAGNSGMFKIYNPINNPFSNTVSAVIGGPYGFSEKVYQAAHEKISMSKMTFSHQMIRLIFVEQIYRAMTILNGGPYHHE